MYLGIDLGTSGVKVLAMDAQQQVVASASAPLSITRPQDGWSEQAPQDWITATIAALAELAQSIEMGDVQGIGLSGQMHGATLLDASDAVLRPCMLWNDTRAHAQAAELDADPAFRAGTGNIVFPGFTAPKVAWVRDNEPEIFDQLSAVLLPKDYLRLWLTGEKVSEMSDAAGTSWLDVGARAWSDQLLEATGLERAQMPHLVEGSQSSGGVRTALAQQFGIPVGTPVAGGAGDNAASAVGLGVTRAGEAFVSLGTSGVLFAASDRYAPAPDSALHTFCHALPEHWHQMGVILAASDALAWYGRLVGAEPAQLTADLGPLQAPGRALFLPYLGGERTPHNDAKVRGAFLGLDHATDRAAGTRAVLEAVAFALRDSAKAMEATGTQLTQLLAVGGGAQSRYWLEAIATALDLPVSVPTAGDFGAAFGAARLGQMAAGHGGAELLSPPQVAETIEPNRDLTSAFDDAYARYTAGYSAVRALS